jgi:hypothetical protein
MTANECAQIVTVIVNVLSTGLPLSHCHSQTPAFASRILTRVQNRNASPTRLFLVIASSIWNVHLVRHWPVQRHVQSAS